MIDQGLIGEVSALLEKGAGRDTVSMQGLGYKQIAAYLCGEISLEEAVYILKRDTRRFAKRQYTWFKRNTDINWYNRDHYREESLLVEDVSGLINDWLKEGAYEQIWAAGTVPE